MVYIDADELLRTLPDDLPYKASVKRVLMQAPKADVAEVKHGKWLMPLGNEPWRKGYFCRCSVCDYINNGHTQKVPSFCECCGAKNVENLIVNKM
jgi:hypothetical protein